MARLTTSRGAGPPGVGYEGDAVAVAPPSLPAGGFRDEHAGGPRDVQGGRVELDELEVRHLGAEAKGHRDPVARDDVGVGGLAIELAGASGGQDGRGRRHTGEPAPGVGDDRAGDPPPFLLQQVQGEGVLAERDAAGGAGLPVQGPLELPARRVPSRVQDAGLRVSAFQAEGEVPAHPVEGRSPADDLPDAVDPSWTTIGRPRVGPCPVARVSARGPRWCRRREGRVAWAWAVLPSNTALGDDEHAGALPRRRPGRRRARGPRLGRRGFPRKARRPSGLRSLGRLRRGPYSIEDDEPGRRPSGRGSPRRSGPLVADMASARVSEARNLSRQSSSTFGSVGFSRRICRHWKRACAGSASSPRSNLRALSRWMAICLAAALDR